MRKFNLLNLSTLLNLLLKAKENQRFYLTGLKKFPPDTHRLETSLIIPKKGFFCLK